MTPDINIDERSIFRFADTAKVEWILQSKTTHVPCAGEVCNGRALSKPRMERKRGKVCGTSRHRRTMGICVGLIAQCRRAVPDRETCSYSFPPTWRQPINKIHAGCSLQEAGRKTARAETAASITVWLAIRNEYIRKEQLHLSVAHNKIISLKLSRL